MFRIRAYLTNTCLACFDLAITTASYCAVRWMALNSGRDLLDPEATISLGFVLVLWIAVSSYFGMYRSRRLDSPLSDVIILFKVGLASWIILECVSPILPALAPTRFLPIRFAVMNFLALAVARSGLRLVFRELRRRGHDVKRLVLVASPQLGQRLAEKFEQRSHYGYCIVHRFVYSVSGPETNPRLVNDVREYVESYCVDDVILALPAPANDVAAQLVAICESQGISVRIVPDLFPLIQTDTQIYDLDGIPLVNARLYPTEYFGYIVFKRAFDVCISLLVLTILSPLYLLLALFVKTTSPGPVFFTQERVGLNGRKFRILKYRTMRQGPSLDPDSHWTVRNDRYVTPLGRWLRRSNLDELPQFLNVLKGEMSIVGPRPERPFFLERFRKEVPEYMARHYVKSGITGWAQVHGWRGDTPIPERVAHDLYYIRNWAVTLDIKILFLTLRTFFHRNAG